MTEDSIDGKVTFQVGVRKLPCRSISFEISVLTSRLQNGRRVSIGRLETGGIFGKFDAHVLAGKP